MTNEEISQQLKEITLILRAVAEQSQLHDRQRGGWMTWSNDKHKRGVEPLVQPLLLYSSQSLK